MLSQRDNAGTKYQTYIAFGSFNIVRQFSDEIISGLKEESFICSFCFLLAHGTLLSVSTVLHQFICCFLFLLASGTSLQAITVQINSSVLYSIPCRIGKLQEFIC
jgi:hypothetical protein